MLQFLHVKLPRTSFLIYQHVDKGERLKNDKSIAYLSFLDSLKAAADQMNDLKEIDEMDMKFKKLKITEKENDESNNLGKNLKNDFSTSMEIDTKLHLDQTPEPEPINIDKFFNQSNDTITPIKESTTANGNMKNVIALGDSMMEMDAAHHLAMKF